VSAVRWRLLPEAAVSLVVARISLSLIPFSRLAKGYGRFVPPGEAVNSAAAHVDEAGQAIAREVGWAVRCAARNLPVELVCLPQAMAAHAMLRRRGIASIMHFGAGKKDGPFCPLDAHAWLDAGNAHVTGYPVASHLVEIGCFI
jgi:hypothetical protein